MSERDPEKALIVYEPTTAAHHQEEQQHVINDTRNEIPGSVESRDRGSDNLEAASERLTLISVDQQQDQIQNGSHTDPAHNVIRSHDFAPVTQDSQSGQPTSSSKSKNKYLNRRKKSKATTPSKVSDEKIYPTASPHAQDPSTLPDSSSPNSKDSSPSSEDPSSTSEAPSFLLSHFVEDGRSFIQRLRDIYGPIVLINEEDRFDVNLASFQRVQLEVLQKHLIDVIFGFIYQKVETPDEARHMQRTVEQSSRLMKRYVQAWKDLEFMTSVGKHGGYDPFIVSADIRIQKAALMDEADLWNRVPADHIRPELREELETLRQNICGRPPPIDSDETEANLNIIMGGGTRASINDERRIEDRVKKTLMALTGGVFLIVPMLIMVLCPGKVTSLVTTSVCVFVFGLVMSLLPFLERPFDVLTATAAYAAVLVVFVGTGGGT